MFADEIIALLEAKGIGVFGTNMFVGSKAIIPVGDGPFLVVVETGGTGATRVQNQKGAKTRRPTAQVSVRGASGPTSRVMAEEAYQALDGVTNELIAGTFYQSITVRGDLANLGEDDSGRTFLSFNIDAERQP